MTVNEKYSWLCYHVPGPFAMAREKAIEELDELTPIFCFCGQLATGFHTARCRKFQDKLEAMVVNKLKNLLPE
ncbi:MAG: hypothetical protein K2H46_00120 [Muribaculaceae bacterium]|nr:hypothetical protein [Muribaculaceae bacterium]